MYKEFYGFSDYPFTLTPDLRFLFMAVTHFEALASMLEGVRERKGITLITGEPGTGKTTLIYALLKDLSEKIKTALVTHTTIEFPDLLKEILQDLGVHSRGNSLPELHSLFGQCLQERLAQDETVAIIVDEAQNLGVEVIRDLLGLSTRQSATAKLVQIVLVGQTELEPKLDSPELQALSSQIALRRRIQPLSPKECGEYIDHRLKVVGSSSAQIFTPEATDRITRFSGGIPRIINILCDNALMAGWINRPKIDGRIAEKTIRQLDYLPTQAPGETTDSPPEASLESIKSGEKEIPEQGPGRLSFILDFLQRKTTFPNAALIFLVLVSLGLGALHFFGWGQKLQSLGDGKEKGGPPEKSGERIVSVKEGWNLSFLAREYYHAANPTLVDLILQFNPQISDLNRIFVGQQIRVPFLTEGLFLVENTAGTYKIHLGTFNDRRLIPAFPARSVLKNKKIEIVPREVSPQVIWFRVMAGEFGTQEEGLRALRTLRQQGLLPAFAGFPRPDRQVAP
jgi:general secretion pathway protein A